MPSLESCSLRRLAGALIAFSALLVVARPASADGVLTPEDEAARRLGFYFSISLERTTQVGHAQGLGFIVDDPGTGAVVPSGPEIDGDFRGRYNLGFGLGFRLRNRKGAIETSFFQLDEGQDLRRQAPDGKRVANALASPLAGFSEDLGGAANGIPGPPDGSTAGYEGGGLAESSEMADAPLDGAEDWNFNRLLTPDFIRFDSSDGIVGRMDTDYKVLDIDYVRRLKTFRKFQVDGRLGLRFATLSQKMDLAYRDVGAFAVYTDDEGASGATEAPRSPCPGFANPMVQDGDGDGEFAMSNNEPDGDGFMDGDCDRMVQDRITSVETVSEDRIVADIDTGGYGLKFGLDGRFDFNPKWRLAGGLAVSVLNTEVEYAYREAFTSERDRFLNFIEWDFNGDGVYDNFDLDFDSSCDQTLGAANCFPNQADSGWIATNGGYISAAMREGAACAVVGGCLGLPPPSGMNMGAYSGVNDGRIRVRDPIPESERNRDILRETTVLADIRGSAQEIVPALDVHLGIEYQFSRFARLNFGLRSSRWFDAGNFRDLASDVAAGRAAGADGDFVTNGYYFMITVVPR